MLQTSNRRNYLLPITILAIATAGFFAYKYFTLTKNTIMPVTTDTTKCGSCMGYNNVKTASKLDVNLLRAMTRNYQLGPNGMGKTRSVWLSLEKLKQFIFEIENNTCNCPTSKLGARVYFGDYPEDQYWTSPNGFKDDLNNPNAPDGDFRSKVTSDGINPYAEITTIIMVPTINDGTKNVDFDPADNPNGCNGGYNIKRYIESAGGEKNYNDPNIYMYNRLGVSVTALSATNHGDACPPLPPTGGCPAIGSYTGFNH